MESETTNKELFEQSAAQERNYWIERLSPAMETSNITLDYERPSAYFAEKDSVSGDLPDQTHDALMELANNSHFLIYSVLLTALTICLHKHTGSASIVVGSPSRRKFDNAPPGASALAIVNEVRGDLRVKQLLLNVRESLLEAYSKQNYPFERLVRDLNLGKIENRCPLFDVALALRNIHSPMPELKNDIFITFSSGEKRTSGTIEFNKALFQKDSIERLKNHFLSVLHQTLLDPNTHIADLEMLGEAERQQLLIEWNDTKRVYSQNKRIHRIFEDQTRRTPETVAVTLEGRQLTYRELNEQANQLARYLRGLGAAPETLVGICMDRTPEAIVSLLGVLKSGAAYVPFDAGYPPERLAFMFGDSQAQVLLTLQRLAEGIPESSAKIVCLDTEWESIAQQDVENLETEPASDNLAYVIYTSGSTGTPKGVMIEHGGLVSVIEAQMETFGIEHDSRVLQFASLNFDASVSEIFTTLLAGGTLYLGTLESLMPGAGLVSLLRNNQITHVTLPPSVLAVLPDVELSSLSTIIAAGEACSADVVRRWGSGRRFLNAYGPTETSICASIGECPDSQRRPSIGRPIWNTQTYLLDDRMKPVPVGAVAELYIGGISLARGYLNRPELTAERFIPDPFSAEPGMRLYRTGDLARHRPDGQMEYLGRIDHQVKIRGYRMELGEIESALGSHEDVRDCIVVAREDAPGDKRLAAYLVTRGEATPSTSELRSFLRNKLPDYMVPSVFVLLEQMPLTPNGKVDRRALPEPQAIRPELGVSYVAPRTPVERKLAEIWVDILGVETIGVEDHFFDLGGHSLLATQVVSRVREAFQVEIPLRWFFVNEPTVAGLARAIQQFQIDQAGADELASALEELEELSDEEVQALLSQEGMVAI